MVALRKNSSAGGFRLTSLFRFPTVGGRHGRGGVVVGLDIEPGYVAAATARQNGRVLVERAVAASLDAETIREGEVVNVEGLAAALRALFASADLPRRVRVGVANQRTVMRMLEVPPFEDRKELEAAVRFQAEDQLPMPLQNAALDFRPLGVVDTPAGPRQRVLLVAAQLETVEKLLAAIRTAGLKAEGVDLSAFALVRSLFHLTVPGGEDQPRRTVLLNVGGLSNLVIAEGVECKLTRVLARGLESIAQEIAERRALPIDQARELLFRIGAGDERTEQAAGTSTGQLSIMGHHAVYQDAETLALQMERERQASAEAQREQQPSFAAPQEAGGYSEPLGEQPPLEPYTTPAAEPIGQPFGSQEPAPAGGLEPAPTVPAEFAPSASQPVDHSGGEPTVAAGPGEAPGSEPPPAPPQPEAVGNTAIGRIDSSPAERTVEQTAVSAEVAETRLLVEAGVRSIAGEVRNTLDFYAAQEPGAPLAELVLCGPALDVPGFARLLERYLGLPVRGEVVSGAPGAFGSSSSNLFAVAAGLSLEEVNL